MSILYFSTTPYNNARHVEIDTDDVLAICNLGKRRIKSDVMAHQRAVYTKAGLLTVWGKAQGENATINELDVLGGKPFTRLACIERFGSAQRQDFLNARVLTISKHANDAADIKVARYTNAVLSRVRVSGAFTMSASAQDIENGTRIHYAALTLGNHAPVFVAHLDPSRVMAFNKN